MTEVDMISNENMSASVKYSPYRDAPPGKMLSDKTEDNRMNVNKSHVPDAKSGPLKPQQRSRRRRVRKGRYGPYSSWQGRRKQGNKEVRFTHGHAVAPYNTTQFLMDEHKGEYETDLELQNTTYQPVFPRRQSLDSEGGLGMAYYSSSPDDEEQFLEKEFSHEYRTYRAERLSNMPKQELIQEYLQLEDRVETLETKLNRVQEREKELADDSDDEIKAGEIRMDPETAEKIRIIQEEFNRLLQENQKLNDEILKLRTNSPCVSEAATPRHSDSYDSDSSSDSSSSSGSSRSCSTCSSDSDSDSDDSSDESLSSEKVAQSPNYVSQSPHQVSQSPYHLSQSPGYVSQSPRHVSQSPYHVAQSPSYVSRSPRHVAQGPCHVTQSPSCVSRSPRHVSQSPCHVSRSPSYVSQSPCHIAQSPSYISQSPRNVSQSPCHIPQSPSHIAQSPCHSSHG